MSYHDLLAVAGAETALVSSKGLLQHLVAGKPHLVRRLRSHVSRRRRPVPPVGQHTGADGPAGRLGVLWSGLALQKSTLSAQLS